MHYKTLINYVQIMIVSGRMMYQILAANKSHMSERTRAAHREIAKVTFAITFQCGTFCSRALSFKHACLPYTFSRVELICSGN